MNVVFLITFLDSQTGGMERQALQLAMRLKARGSNIIFITCIHANKLRQQRLKIRDTFHGFQIWRIPLWPGAGFLNAFLYGAGSLGLLLFLRRRYAIIHAHQLQTSGLLACILKRFLPSKKVIIKNACGGIYGDVNILGRFYWSKWILSFIARTANRCIGVSEETILEMRNVGFERVTLIPNGVDTERFLPLSLNDKEKLRTTLVPSAEGKKILFFVGRLTAQKNITVLLDALELLPKEIELFIAGEGSMRGELEQYVTGHHLEDRVVFLGAVEKVQRWYQIADVFVLPSLSEGMPNVLLEAMSTGVPAVGSDIPAIRSLLVPGETGYVFIPTDVAALVHAISRILYNPEESIHIASRARRIIEQNYSIDTIAQAYITLYASLTHAA